MEIRFVRSGAGVVGAMVLAMVMSGGHAAAQTATGPSFDCAKATGQVEKLICSDAGLSTLDRDLQTVYKAATAKAKGALARTLVAEQSGWIKGRNECWKAQAGNPQFLTASWTVDNAKACADAQYRLRTAELQAVWQLLPGEGPISYQCGTSPANEAIVTYYKSELPSARFERGDQTVTAYLVPVNGGKTYEGRNVSFQRTGPQLAVKFYNVNTGKEEQFTCKVR